MGSIGQWIGLDKLGNLFRIIRHNGGIFQSLAKIYRQVKHSDQTVNFIVVGIKLKPVPFAFVQ